VLTGAILAGGRSLRFGRNKALEVFEGNRLIDRGVDGLRPYCDPVLVVANDLGPYFDVRATLVQDIVPHYGPLGGVYTALLFSPNHWVITRATDMPFLIPDLLQMMLDIREGCDAVVPLLNERYEPLLALYSRRCIPAIADLIESGERKVMAFYRKVRMHYLAETEWRSVDPEGLSFKNVNTPEDWKQLRWN
jgi:molybdenum cofactor guanylyltransferase